MRRPGQTQLLMPWYGTAPFQPCSPTSKAGADAIEPSAGTLESMVYAIIGAAGSAGLNDGEGTPRLNAQLAKLGRKPVKEGTYVPRRRELVRKELVRAKIAPGPTPGSRPVPATRPDPDSGVQRTVWVVCRKTTFGTENSEEAT